MDNCWCHHPLSQHIGGHQNGGTKCIAEGSEKCPCPTWQPVVSEAPRAKPRPRFTRELTDLEQFEVDRLEALGAI